MFASSLRNYSDKTDSVAKLKPRLKSASSVSRIQEVFNKSLMPSDKKVKVRSKSATLPTRHNETKNRYPQISSIIDNEPKNWPPVIKTHSVTAWKKQLPSTETLNAIPFASQPVQSKKDVDRLLDYVTEEYGKSNIKDRQEEPNFAYGREAKIRFYTYDSDVDSQEDGYELLESAADLRDEGVEKIDLPPSSSKIIPLATYNSNEQKNVRVVYRESSSYVNCPQCHAHVPIPIGHRSYAANSQELGLKAPPPPTPSPVHIRAQPIWQPAQAVELTIPKVQSAIPSPTLSLPSYGKSYYRSSECFDTDTETATTERFLSAHSRPRPLSASFYCKKI